MGILENTKPLRLVWPENDEDKGIGAENPAQRDTILLLRSAYTKAISNVYEASYLLGLNGFDLGGMTYQFLFEVTPNLPLSVPINPRLSVVPVLPYIEKANPAIEISFARSIRPDFTTYALRVKGQKHATYQNTERSVRGYALDFFDIRKIEEGTEVKKNDEYYVTDRRKLKKQFGSEWLEKSRELEEISELISLIKNA